MNTHENLSRDVEIKETSDRVFGLVFFVFFLIIALYPTVHANDIRLWALAVSLLTLLLALIKPSALSPFNKLWLRLGDLLHLITSPIILGLLFYGIIMPIGLMIRAMGKDLLRQRLDPDTQTYWIKRTPPGPAKQSLDKQF